MLKLRFRRPLLFPILSNRLSALATPALLLGLLTPLPARAAGADDVPPINSSALINAQLDRQIKLDLNNVLPKALELITEKTGVPIHVQRIVWDSLPYGQETNLTVKIDHQTLRQALDAITHKLGLSYSIEDENIELQPTPALRRLARRSTVEELSALDALSALTLPDSTPAHLSVQQLIDAVDAKLTEAKTPYAIENRTKPAVVHPDHHLSLPRNCSLADALEALSRATPATWYPWGKTIVVLDKQDEISRQLARNISVRYSGVDLSQVLSELQHLAGMRFIIDPGAVMSVPPESRNIRLMLENSSVQDALDALSGATGLIFTIEDDGVRISHQAGSTSVHTPTLGWVHSDIGMDILVPESAVSPDMREYLNHKRQEALDKIRQQMKREGFKPSPQGSDASPSSQPTTSPATNEDL